MKKKTKKILSAKEPKPFRVENVKGKGHGLVICDHASPRIPASLKNLGVKKSDRMRHIGWDIGAEDISLYVAKKLGMRAVIANYSRLVVDLNRTPSYPECILEESDGTEIPANLKISKEARAQRMKEIFHPYQDAVKKQVDRLAKKNPAPLLLAIHSMTNVMGGKKRPWHIAVLWNREEKIAKKLIAELRKNNPALLIGENEPYSLKDDRFEGSTLSRHGEMRKLPYVFIEFRQDLVDTKKKAHHWADIFLQSLDPVLKNLETLRRK